MVTSALHALDLIILALDQLLIECLFAVHLVIKGAGVLDKALVRSAVASAASASEIGKG